MDKAVIVSVASLGRENYNEAQLRLIKSCVDAEWKGDYMMRSVDGYCDRYEGVDIKIKDGWPMTEKYGVSWQQADSKYQFKPFAIQEAREKGYTKILWCDSTILMSKIPNALFELASEQGIVAFDNLGHPLHHWINNTALSHLGIAGWAEEIKSWKQIMACCIILDFTHPITTIVFDKWIKASIEQAFFDDNTNREDFKGNRHDQSYLSALVHMHQIPLLDYGALVYSPHDETKEYGDNYFFINKGL